MCQGHSDRYVTGIEVQPIINKNLRIAPQGNACENLRIVFQHGQSPGLLLQLHLKNLLLVPCALPPAETPKIIVRAVPVVYKF